MILPMEKPYDEYTIRSLIWLSCDYCGKEFQRVKKSINKLNTIIEKDSCGDKSCTQKKREEVFLKKHGDKNLFKSQTFKNKQLETNLIKFGTSEYFSSEDFKQKRKNTLVSKHGVESPLQSPEILHKQQQTCLDRFGVNNYALVDGFNEQRKKTNLQKYGTESPMQNPMCLQKRDETSKTNFGKKSYTQTPEYWTQRKKTCKERYGVEHPSQLKENRDKARQTNVQRYGVPNYSLTEDFKQKYAQTCFERYGVSCPLSLPKNQIYGKTQNEVKSWLNEFGYNFDNNFSVLQGQEIDLYDPDLQIGIEYCGLFWHTELSLQPRLKNYHYDKYTKCLSQGVRLITIFEDEWKNKQTQCKGILQSIIHKQNNKIYARKCVVREIDKDIFKNFCNKYHLLGSNNLGLKFFALLFNGEIVAGMSLGRHHRKSSVLTLDRLCYKSDIQIPGGASKLFKKCCAWSIEQGYEEIVSWSDNRWSQGNIYRQLGFKLDIDLPPDYSYVDIKKPYVRISKQSQKKTNTGCDKNTTERQYCLEKGLARIWDCGKKRWVFSLV